jgi:type VI secretion system secreted protein VgrG
VARKVNIKAKTKGGKEIKPLSHFALMQKHNWYCTFEISQNTNEKLDMLTSLASDFIGQQIDIEISKAGKSGKGSQGELKFAGIISDVNFINRFDGTHDIVFRGFSPDILLNSSQHIQSFTEKSLKQIFQKVLEPAQSFISKKKLSPNFSNNLPYVVQYEESSLHFLHRLANRYGEWFYYDGQKLILGPPEGGNSVKLEYGKNLSSIDFGIRIRPASFWQGAYNYEKNELFEVESKEAKSGGLDQDKVGKIVLKEGKKLYEQPSKSFVGTIEDRSTLKKISDSHLGGLENEMVVFSGRSDDPQVQLGKKISVFGKKDGLISKQTSEYGEFLVIEANHFSNAGNYYNEFKAIPVAAQVPPINRNLRNIVADTQIAVVKDNNDPDKLGRIKVQFLWQKGSPETSPWIRLVNTHGGSDYGSYFVPEIDDEVLIGFEFSDPEKPYVLGSLYHKNAKPQSDWIDKDNNHKAILTKSGNQIFINDKGGSEEIKIFNKEEKNIISMTLKDKGIIKIKTEGLLEMEADEIKMKAQNINIENGQAIKVNTQSMETSASQSYKVDSGQTLEMSAGQSFKSDAGQSMEITSGTSLKVESMSVKLDATQASVKSKAQLDLDGGAMANLKAGLVKIN